MEYRIEHDTLGEVKVPADHKWELRHSGLLKILKSVKIKYLKILFVLLPYSKVRRHGE